jgi:outer membrane protein TolC
MYELDPTRVNYIGFQITLPLPVCNTHQGEILQRQAERHQVALQVRQLEVQAQQDVQGALTRLADARAWAETYRTKVLPDLHSGLADIEKLFAQAEPGVDVLRVLDIQRKLLKARDGYLDALYELSQARADLALAVGDLSLVLPSCFPVGTPEPSSPTKE